MDNRQQGRAAQTATKKKTDSAFEVLLNSDPLSFTTTKIQALYNGATIGNATGFFYRGFGNYWFVTNWHVLCGRKADNPLKPLDPRGRVPSRIRLKLVIRPGQPEYEGRLPEELLFQEQIVDLYNKDGQALWYQHPTKNLQDVAVFNASGIVDRIHLLGVNEVATTLIWPSKSATQFSYLGIRLGSVFLQICRFGRGVL